MQLARSLWLKALITVAVAAVFVWLLEVSLWDPKHALLPAGFESSSSPSPAPGARVNFTATAYCKGPVTSAGVAARAGVVASDPSLLPLGSVVQLDVRADRYDGIYTVLDTGPAVQGRKVDIYMWSCNEALKFGRRLVGVTILRLGWSPTATTPSLMQRLLSQPQEKRVSNQ